MPNRFQLAFLGSFFGVFATLVLVSNFVRAKLKAAGYDVSRLILIGLPKDETRPPPPAIMSAQSYTVTSQLLAFALAAGTFAFAYYKFGGSTLFLLPSMYFASAY
jgi:cytochrome-b5 reductase